MKASSVLTPRGPAALAADHAPEKSGGARSGAVTIPAFRPDGSVMDLAAVTASDISFAEMAAGLSKIARLSARYAGAAYSVGQHSVFVADALYHETGNAELAGCGLLHDGHEYLIGDLTHPMEHLIANAVMTEMSGMRFAADIAAEASFAVYRGIHAIKTAIDEAVFAAAGIGYPRLYPGHRRLVEDMDARMLRAEGLALFGKAAAAHLPAGNRPAPMLRAAIEPWGAAKAEIAFLDRLERYLGIVARAA